ncbi:hypothetical protein NFI96_021603 [Prochilodus magdalenae]|nr:hypothetical protein NFI96_021603 [Prochilodus magdalenae]
MGFGGLVLVLLAGALASSHLLDKHQPTRNLTCSQGLDQCRVETREFQPEPLNAGPVEVSGLDVKAALCCKDQKCSACLLITVRLKILDEEEVSGEQLEDEDKEDDEDDGERLSGASVTVCFYSGPNLPNYKVISFKVTPAARQNPGNAQLTLVEYRDVFLGSTVNVTVRSLNRTVTLPRPKEAPRVLPVFGREKGVVELKVAEEDAGQAEPLRICVKRGPEGMCQKSSTVIPLHTVTPCMCIEAWVEGSMSRSASCPFAEYQEFRENVWRNMSLSVGHSETNDGRPMLRWTLSAPCRVKAEVWPCRIGVGSGQSCREVDGFRQRCNGSSNWREDSATLWTSGEFVDVSSENLLLHCVMFQAEGRTFGPVCQHDTQRGRWSVLVLMALLVFILVGVAVCFLRNRLRGVLATDEQSRTGQDRTGQDRAGQGRAGQGRTGQGRTGQGRTGQGRTGQDRTGQGRTGQGRAGQGRTGQGRAGQGRTGQGRAGQGRTGQGRAGQDRAGQGRAGQGRTGQGRTGQGRAGQGRTGQDRAGQGRAGQGRAGQSRTEQGRAGQDRAEQGRTGQGRAGQGRAGQDRTGQDRAGQSRTGQSRTEQGRTEQDRAGQDRAGQDRTGQDRTGQSRTGQDRTGQSRTEQDRTGQDRAGQGRAGQGRTEQDRAGQDRTGQDRTGQGRTGQGRAGQDRTGQGRTGQGRTGQDSCCVSDWETSHSPGGARGEVLLLHASGSDVAEAALVCRLGVELSELGFAVSLDLWSQAELSSLGPGPWLHSKLDLLQRRGGKALLVLSDSALGAAQACWDGWSGETTRAAGPPPAKMDRTAWDKPSPCLSDVFGSALSYVFSMYQKGGATEHFVLVHLDSRKLLNGERAMPLLFQGLQLYTLPSESRQLLGQLCPERQESFSMRLKRLLWLRRASGRLTKGLKDAGKGSRPHSQSVLTQVEILEEERLPLHV